MDLARGLPNNTIRLRRFDGAHLAFPGMNPHVTLRPHQKDAVWRIMSSGNTLLAHAVGAGKTCTRAAAGMKLKQAGLIHKPLYVVPNHLLEQFGREFLQLYPNARLLMAGKDDVTRERRKLLTARIASGAWDGIITTHSSFERMGMSRDSQAQFLQEQIATYAQLLCADAAADTSRAQRNIIKALEKQKAKREDRLLDKLAAAGKTYALPSGSRAMETGGYKGKSRELTKSGLHAAIRRQLGIPGSHIVCEYGMCELSSQAYDGIAGSAGEGGRVFRFPPWARARVVSPETGCEVADGEGGMIQIFDLANAWSVLAIQTEDLGVRRGDGFELTGRAARAEPRGCSLMAGEMEMHTA
jgi:hypothetical protein